jgi:3'(2'), 5'-bisphosphate nucleotidase
MTDFLLDQELNVAIKIAEKALKITEWFKTHTYVSFKKKDESPVTIADFASQIYILSELKRRFPDDKFIAEEENVFLDDNTKISIDKCFNDLNIDIDQDLNDILNFKGGKSERSWAIDPIDGTIGFQKNLYYAVGIGLLFDSEPILAVISIPNYQDRGLALFSAIKGKGAKASYAKRPLKPIHVSKTENFEDAVLGHSLHHDEPWVMDFSKRIGIKKLIQIDSMAKFCLVADGSADIYLKPIDHSRSFTWDFCQGDLLVKEAGGVVTDTNNKNLKYQGENCLFTGLGVVAANPSLHEKTIDRIKKIFKN